MDAPSADVEEITQLDARYQDTATIRIV